jgi:hypothetical protein
LLSEDALTNSSLSFWAFPYLQLHQASEESRRLFFKEQIDPQAYGYGLEIGIAYNSQLKLSIYGQQLLNTSPESEFNQFVARLVAAYRF